MAPSPLTVLCIGWRAQVALARADAIHPIGAFSASAYLAAGGELIWLGRAGASLHPRAVLVPRLPDQLEGVSLDASQASVWRPSPVDRADRARLADACRALRSVLPRLGQAAGLGVLLLGRVPAFPLDGAREAATALARACAEDDPAAAALAAEGLIGLGPGLTPAGDDFVGGAFFARALLGSNDRTAKDWAGAAARLRAVARARTHPISAVLLADLLAGEGYEPLHDLAGALAAGSTSSAIVAAGRLTRIGHSSGWDLLAGLLAGVLGAAALDRTAAAARSVRDEST